MITMDVIYERLWRDVDQSITEAAMAAAKAFNDLLEDTDLSTEKQMRIGDACTRATNTAEKMGFYAGFRIASQLCRLMEGVGDDKKTG